MALLKAHTAYGTVVGMPTTYQASTIFKGIPYAAAPVGDLRWSAPQPPAPWTGERQAYTYGSIPLQMRPLESNFFRKEFYPIEWPSSEDCLYMNVITPAEHPDEKLPVALWIYGGAFVQGYGHKLETDGEAFAQRGVVYVSFNYRVGPLGFLSCPSLDEVAPSGRSGNYGLMDQIAALNWVRENIAAFGGDPEKITVFGQSAGAISIFHLLNSPLAQGKIHAAIMESGGGPTPSEFDEDDIRSYSQRFFDSLGCASVEQARAIPGDQLFASWLSFLGENPPQRGLALHPVSGDFVMPQDAASAMRAGSTADIPCMIGSMAEEDRAFGGGAGMRDCFLGSSLAFCENRARTAEAPTFLYHMTNHVPGEPQCGAFHSSEHMYIFQTFLRSHRPYSGADFDLSNIMCALWTNFVKNGDPNGIDLPVWDAYRAGEYNALRFDRNLPVEMFQVPAYNGVARELAQKLS